MPIKCTDKIRGAVIVLGDDVALCTCQSAERYGGNVQSAGTQARVSALVPTRRANCALRRSPKVQELRLAQVDACARQRCHYQHA